MMKGMKNRVRRRLALMNLGTKVSFRKNINVEEWQKTNVKYLSE